MAYKINIHFENCSYDAYYSDDEIGIGLATSKLIFVFTSENFATIQSSKDKIRELKNAIHNELAKFKWIIYGDVNLDFTWYFSAVRKKETDAIGDLDNLMKPIIDSFTGFNGIFIDDSQIGSINELWLSKDVTESEDTVLRLEINFNNDDCCLKENTKFVELEKSKYALYLFDDGNKEELLKTLIRWHIERKYRTFIDKEISKNPNFGLYKTSFNVFHTSRLNGVDATLKYNTERFKSKCKKAGITFHDLLKYYGCFYKSIWKLVDRHIQDSPGEKINRQSLFFTFATKLLDFPGNIICKK